MSLRLDHMNEYKVWKNMRARCSSKCNKDSVYQLHNIKVCDRWNVFDNFFKDMGVKPDGYTIDRIDTLGDYCPENCRWASWSTQSKNRGSFNTVVNYNGIEMCLKDLSKIVNIDYTTLIYRFKKFKNLSIEEIINYKDPRLKSYVLRVLIILLMSFVTNSLYQKRIYMIGYIKDGLFQK